MTSVWDLVADYAFPEQERYASDPVAWAKERAGVELWSKQRQVIESVRDNPETAVHSCHNTGKSFGAAVATCWWLDVHPPGSAFVVTCYADDVEVLTKEGWKLFKDVRVGVEGDQFATRNPSTQEFEWQPAGRYYKAPWDGEVVHLKSGAFDMRVTPNHRVLRYHDDSNYWWETICRADELSTTRGTRIPMQSSWKGKTPNSVRFGQYEWDAVTFASFLGAWLAEGSLGFAPWVERAWREVVPKRGGGGVINITQIPGTKGYDPYCRLLSRMLGRKVNSKTRDLTFANSELWYYLRDLGKAGDKHVPAEVLDWGPEALDALLYYYLLGDGYYQKPNSRSAGAWKSWTVSKELADDLQEIAQKLGGSATVVQKPPRMGGSVDGRQIVGKQPVYQVTYNTALTREIKPHRSHYSGNVYCVSVPNEMLYVRVRDQGRAIWCCNTAPTGPQVKAILWREIGKLHKVAGLPGRTNLTEWYIGDEIVAYGRKPSEYNPDGFQGIHAEYVLVVLDEACGIPKPLWDAASSLTSNDASRTLAIGNPDNPHSEFARICKTNSGWSVIHIGAFDTPNFTNEKVNRKTKVSLITPRWAESKARSWGEKSALYTSKVLGEFPTDAEKGVVPWSWAVGCRLLQLPAEGTRCAGLDVGGGGDLTVLRERIGGRVGRVRQWQESDPMVVCGEIALQLQEWDTQRLIVDVLGIGWGLAGRLKELSSKHNRRGDTAHSAEVVGFSASEKSTQPKRFVNKRSELWWEVGRELSRLRGWDLEEVDDDTLAELTEPEYKIVDSHGKIQVEARDQIVKKLGRSPDRATALLMAFWEGSTVTVKLPVSGRTLAKMSYDQKRRQLGIAGPKPNRLGLGSEPDPDKQAEAKLMREIRASKPV